MDLDELHRCFKREETLVGYPTKLWPNVETAYVTLKDKNDTTLSSDQINNCIVVGAGQTGLTIAYGLKREQINKVILLDEQSKNMTGPWSTYARMEMLRTPKEQSGFDLGIPSLTFQSWYEAQYGQESWNKLFRIPRNSWQAYINWYRDVTCANVLYDTKVADIEPVPISNSSCKTESYIYKITSNTNINKNIVLYTRTVVISTGALGAGGALIPENIKAALPKKYYADVNEWPINFSRFKNKNVAIIGAGASAFDAANECLNAGACKAVIYARRATMPLTNPRRWMEFSGFLANYSELPDLEKWRYMNYLQNIGQPPPEPTFLRSLGYEGFELKLGNERLNISLHEGMVRLSSSRGTYDYDYLFSAAGFITDLSTRDEFRTLYKDILLWGERLSPPENLKNERLANYPYLGRFSQLTEKNKGLAPWLENVFIINRSSTLSMGPTAASISNVKYAARIVISGVSRALFLSESNNYYNNFLKSDHTEIRDVKILNYLSHTKEV
ncbi:NAD(P)/FAD-dependent oxidoreductase [Acidithiobacillus ferrivorans]|nr:NAD(P)/FAD-dependent oxidoreductase [Acidithiobacillus ferrivorans]